MPDRIFLGHKNFNRDYQDRRDLWLPMFVRDNQDLIAWCTSNLTDWHWQEQVTWDWVDESRYSFRVLFYAKIGRQEDLVAWYLRPAHFTCE